MAAHAVAVSWLCTAALWLLLPLTNRLETHVPGYFPGDNVAFLWNTWWFRESLQHGHTLGFWCDRLFAPWGTSLVLHTHSFLEAAIGTVLFPGASAVVAHNLTVILGVIANGLCTYLLAFHYTRRTMPSLIAGTMFTWSTFVAIHMAGHINLVHAWVLPLSAWCAVRMLDRPSYRRVAATACAVAAVAYSDYYYLVYVVLLVGLLTLARWRDARVELRRPRPPQAVFFLAGAVVVVGLIAAVRWTGGWSVTAGPWLILMHGTRNLAAAATVLTAAAALAVYRIRFERVAGAADLPTRKQWIAGAALVLVLIAPLATAALGVALRGSYAGPRLLWRSSPSGIDVATLIEGPPRHLIFGELVTVMYAAAKIDPIEQSGWLGLVSTCAALVALMRYRRERDVRSWLLVGGVFFAVAIGPFVKVAGMDTGIPGPFALLRYVPILSNARIPGRAMVMVQLACAMLTAMVLARRTRSWRDCVVWLLVLLAETVPRPSPLYALPQVDVVDRALRDAPGNGAVLELPTGLRDGFGIIGGLDHRMLVHQMVHDRPLVGGFVARLSPALRAEYLETPFLAAALALSDPEHPRDEPITADAAARLGVRFLVVNRDTLNPLRALTRDALAAAGFQFVIADGDRELYAVSGGRGPGTERPQTSR